MILDKFDKSQAIMSPDPSHAYYNRGAPNHPFFSGIPTSLTQQQPGQQPGIPDALQAYFAQVGRPNNASPFGGSQFGLPYNPSQPPPFMPPQPYQPQPIAPSVGQFGRPFGQSPFMSRMPSQQGGGYDGSGINPGGMYFPQNPGGFRPMRNLGFGGR